MSQVKWLVVIIGTVFLGGCAPFTSTQYAGGNEGGGVPYVLPKSIMAIQVQAVRNGNGVVEDLRFSLAPKLVPDPDSGIYYLRSNLNPIYKSEHSISVENGLLTSVNAKDYGSAGDVALSLLNSGISLYKFGQLGPVAQSATQSPFVTDDPYPTAAEVAFLLAQLGTDMSFNYDPDISGIHEFQIPGTKGLLYIISSVSAATEVCTEQPTGCPTGSSVKNGDRFDGVYTRTLEPRTADLGLFVDPMKLAKRRVEEIVKAYASAARTKNQLAKTESDQREDQKRECGLKPAVTQAERRRLRANYTKQIDTLSALKIDSESDVRLQALISRIADLESARDDLNENISACDVSQRDITSTTRSIKRTEEEMCRLSELLLGNGVRKISDDCPDFGLDVTKRPLVLELHCPVKKHDSEPWWCRKHKVRGNSDVVLLAKKDRLRMPIRRAGVGTTENNLSFVDGIVTGYSSNHPSTAQVIGTTVETGLRSIVSLPSELVQLKVDLANRQTDLAQGQKELREAMEALSEEVARQSEIQNEIALLNAQLDLARTQEVTTAGLRSLDSVRQRTELEEQQRLLEQQTDLTDAQIALDERRNELEGILAETRRLRQQTALLEQEGLLRDQHARRDPVLEGAARETERLNAEQERLEAQIEIERLRRDLLDLQEEIDQLQSAGSP